jgi:undecaprenyl diphosphate synthase
MPELLTLPNRALPTHVAIIMDGNGRWAKARGLPRTAGHRRGAEAVRRTMIGAAERHLQHDIAKLAEEGVRLCVIGERERLPIDIVRLIGDAEEQTKSNDRITVAIAISYGSRQEIAAAARYLAAQAVAGKIEPDAIDEEVFAACLMTADMPDPDLVVRTSGEQRISNFLLWQSAYSELIFIDKLWPDFDKEDLAEAIREFQQRDRRYGAVASSG